MKFLREEILKGQEYQRRLNQWKIILVSALAATGIGIGAKGSFVTAYYVLLAVPLVCIYIDQLFYQDTLRVFLIANFIRTFCTTKSRPLVGENRLMQKYEAFVHNVRNYRLPTLFEHGKRAQYWSSIILTLTLPGLGLFLFVHQPEGIVPARPPEQIVYAQQPEMIWIGWVLFIGVMIIGTIIHIWGYHNFKDLLTKVNLLKSPIVNIVHHNKKDELDPDMVELIEEIADYNCDYLMPHCISSLSWSSQESKKEGMEILKKIKEEIDEEKKKEE